MSYQIGLITEDISDFDVVDEIIRKLVPKSKYSIKKYVGHGCGKIIGKCRDWAIDLKRRNCSILIILHDLDNQTETLLYKRLNQAMSPSPISKFVLVIPVQEIEAWLLSDLDAIKKALNLQATLPKIPNPESILNPKEHLGQMVYAKSKKHYINTVHNRKIAANLSLNCVRKCKSFKPLEEFVLTHLK